MLPQSGQTTSSHSPHRDLRNTSKAASSVISKISLRDIDRASAVRRKCCAIGIDRLSMSLDYRAISLPSTFVLNLFYNKFNPLILLFVRLLHNIGFLHFFGSLKTYIWYRWPDFNNHLISNSYVSYDANLMQLKKSSCRIFDVNNSNYLPTKLRHYLSGRFNL